MHRPIVALMWILLCVLPDAASAQSKATIVYDVKLREFTCWTEEQLPQPLVTNPVVISPASPNSPRRTCNTAAGWHPVTSDLYFVRGQAISILLVNAVALDLFSLEVTADELPEPSTALSGSFGELPKMVPLIPAPTLIPGVNAVLSAGPASIQPTEVYRRLTASDDKDFAAWLRNTLVAPLTVASINNFFALDSATALERLGASTVAAWITEVKNLSANVKSITTPVDTEELIDRTRALVGLLDAQLALRGRLAAHAVPAAGKTISDAIKALNTSELSVALAIDSADFERLVAEFELAFPAEFRYSRIQAITADKDSRLGVDPKYKDGGSPQAEMSGLLNRIQADAGGSVTADVLKRLKKNLEVLSDLWNEVRFAQGQSTALAKARADIDAHRNSAASVFGLQAALNELADNSIRKASELNAAAATVPLDDRLRILPAGQWFGSKTISITIKKGQRAAMFDLAGVTSAAGGSVTSESPENSNAKPIQPSALDFATARTFKFPIYNMYHFQLGLGAAYSSADDQEFKISSVSTGSGDSSKTEKFIEQTIARDYNLLWTANVIIFPRARHAFPWRPRYPGERRPSGWTNVGAVVGFSMTDPSRNFLFGGAWFRERNTVGVQVSWHIAMRDVFVGDPEAALTKRVTSLERKRFNGASFGLIVTPDFFTKVLSPIFKQ